MDSSSHYEKRLNAEGDRLSNLPEDIIYKILSFLEIKQAIETSELSSRWRYMWTSMPSLSFSSEKFHSVPEFSKFVAQVLSRRNDQIEVSSVNLTFRDKISKMIVKRISNYMFSHNVQQLKINYCPKKEVTYQLPVLISQSLQNLTLTRGAYNRSLITTPHTWELPALTILYLYGVTLHFDNTDKSDGLFSNCTNLKNLTMIRCQMTGLDVFNICHPGLSSLTLERSYRAVNVVTPQLKNLTIKCWHGKLLISAPNLCSFRCENSDCLVELSGDFPHVEKVDICISSCYSYYQDSDDPDYDDKEIVHPIASLLQRFQSVKFLTLSLEAIKALSSSLEVISHQPSPFTNLKSLKIYPGYVTPEEETQPKITMSTDVKNYLLDGSPGANFTMVSHEEIRDARNVVSIEKLMRELQVKLDGLKENSKTCMTDTDQVENDGMTPPDTKPKGHFGERVARVKSYLEDTNKQWERGHENSGCIILMLWEIEKVLTKLPALHRAKLQAKFSGLSAEAGTIMDNIMDNFKNQCYKAPRFKCLLS